MADGALSWVLVGAVSTGVVVAGLSLTTGSAEGAAFMRGLLAFAAVALFGWAVVYVVDVLKAGAQGEGEDGGSLVDVRLPSEDGRSSKA
jgi:hypothetical protein